jgi:hypothetical protein
VFLGPIPKRSEPARFLRGTAPNAAEIANVRLEQLWRDIERHQSEYFAGLGETLRNFIRPMISDMGWAVTLAALVFMWIAMTRSRGVESLLAHEGPLRLS